VTSERKVSGGATGVPIVVHVDAPPVVAMAMTISTRPCDWAEPARAILWPELRERMRNGSA
jgi:hypothetical protein